MPRKSAADPARLASSRTASHSLDDSGINEASLVRRGPLLDLDHDLVAAKCCEVRTLSNTVLSEGLAICQPSRISLFASTRMIATRTRHPSTFCNVFFLLLGGLGCLKDCLRRCLHKVQRSQRKLVSQYKQQQSILALCFGQKRNMCPVDRDLVGKAGLVPSQTERIVKEATMALQFWGQTRYAAMTARERHDGNGTPRVAPRNVLPNALAHVMDKVASDALRSHLSDNVNMLAGMAEESRQLKAIVHKQEKVEAIGALSASQESYQIADDEDVECASTRLKNTPAPQFSARRRAILGGPRQHGLDLSRVGDAEVVASRRKSARRPTTSRLQRLDSKQPSPPADERPKKQPHRPGHRVCTAMYDNIARYVKACDNEGVLVTKQEVLLPKDVRVVDLSRRHISDVAISTLVEPIATRSQDVSVMDLSHNTIVDGVMKILGHIIPPAVRHVSDEPMWRLDTLNLSHNPLSTESIKELGQVIRLNCLHVRRLDLSGVPMAMKAFSAISWAVSRGQQITEIGLANTQCGRHCQDACQVVVRLCTVVEKIDLSCNYFKEEGLAALGSVLASKDAMVKVLSLAENVWAATCDSVNRLAHGGDSRMLPGADTAFEKSCVRDANALNILAEAIGDNNSLEDLSLAGSQLDQRTAICLEDSILQHPTLQHIDVSRNPLGLAGLRAILRLVADERSPLRGVTARELRGSSPDPLVAYNPVCMNFDYTGSRSLNMGLPYHRAIVRLLVRRGDALQIRLSFLLKDFAVNGTPAAFIFERCSDGLRRKVPKSGVVTFHFTLVDAAGGHSTASEEVLDWHRRRKTKVAMERFLLLMKLWRQEVTQEDRPLFLEAMFQDLRYNNGQAMCFLHEVAKTDPPLLPSVLSHMFGGIDDISLGVVISVLRNVRWTGGYYLKLPARVVEDSVKQASNLVFLNPDSPTGRYAFNLRYPADHVALDRFFIVAHWDAATAAKRTLPDFTEAGDHYGIRNFTVNDVWVEYKPSWMPPDCWDLRVAFDFVSSLKPCVVTARQRSRTRKVNSMPACTFVQLVSLLRAEGTDAAEESRFRALRGHADKVLVDASQLRSVLEAVGPAWRVEFFVLLFPRCLSRGAPLNDNFKGILADRNFFDEDSVSQISERLGPANVFDIMTIHCRPKNVFCFDFSRRDQALLFRRLVMQIALAETANGIKNNVSLEVIQKIRFHEDGCERCFWRIPDEWYSSLPPSGRVVFVYSLSDPRMVLTDVRAHFARTVLGWMDVYASR